MINIMCAVTGLFLVHASTDLLLEKIRDETIFCDYLIVCQERMSQAAVSLAAHRNAYQYDDVTHARVALLSDIIEEFALSDGRKRDKALWYAVKYAREHWQGTLKYLVLIGDDAYEIDSSDSIPYSCGIMPTGYLGTKAEKIDKNWKMDITDDFYMTTSSEEPPVHFNYENVSALSIGRIPAYSAELCSIYVDKVKRYDMSKGNRKWKNTVIAIADDNYQGELPDPVSMSTPFQISCDRTADLCKGFSIKKLYTSMYLTNQFKTKPAAKKAIVNLINSGAGITFYYGHGHKDRISDEEILTYSDFDRFENDLMPTMFFSFSCDNGNFMPESGDPMCKRYLFAENGGCIAYLGSRTIQYAQPNDRFGMTLFKKLNDNLSISLGQLVAETKIECSNNEFMNYYLLGDPALRCFTKQLTIQSTLVQDPDSPAALRLDLPGSDSSTAEYSYHVQFSYVDTLQPGASQDLKFGRDSVVSTVSGLFRKSVDVEIPYYKKRELKAVAYVWNDHTEGNSELHISRDENAPIVTTAVKGAGKHVDITVQNNILTINNNNRLPDGLSGTCTMYDLQGRMVANLNVLPGQYSIDLKTIVASSGRYLLLFSTGDILIKKVCMIVS